jgi:sugar lactone lactonase YvrE
VALIAVCLVAASALGLRRTAAQKFLGAASKAVSATAAPSVAVVTETSARSSSTLGEFAGSFDSSARQLKLTQPEAGSPSAKSRRVAARSDANTLLPSGSFAVRLTNTNGAAADSAFFSSGELAGTVSGEVEIINNSPYPFYNTRLVFTEFRLGSSSGAIASNSPVSGGLAYYNDGQVAFNNRLNVSRNYGDIAPNGGTSRAIWTFSVPTSGPTFYFRFQILADIGVAAESVEPAAVQVSASSGSSVIINGRGFAGTPRVDLLDSNGNIAADLPVASASATQLSVNIPAGTAPGTYGLRVTNIGGTPGGVNSSTLYGRLSVTGQPDAAHTLSGPISSLGDTGPYLISGRASITSEVTVLPGTVIYFANGAALQIGAGGRLTANGGIPGVTNGASVGTPRQIVFTANRTPGEAMPPQGAWDGIQAAASSGARLTFRNCVTEYGGQEGSAQISINDSNGILQFTDSISRRSAGSGLAAAGTNDSLVGFARARIENNGLSASDPAVRLSGNAALGLFDLDGTTSGTSVADANFYYSSANVFTGNANDAVQIGTDAQAGSNDFTRSGVLVGQGDTPIQIRGSNTNPAIIGNDTAPGAELTISATAMIQLAAGADLQAGDLATGKFGGLAANGFSGFTQVPGAAAGSSQYIHFDKIPNGSNFGAIYFSRQAAASSILNFVRVQNGGAGLLGSAEVITDGVPIKIANSQINNSSSGGILETSGGTFNTINTTFSNNARLIDTVAGGQLGDGNLATKANFVFPAAIARDPQGRGLYVADAASAFLIRFVNTTTSTVIIAGQAIPAGAIKTVAGGGLDNLGEDIAGLSVDAGTVTGLATSISGDLLYFIDQSDPYRVRALNTTADPLTFASTTIGAGRVSTIATGLGNALNGLSVNPNNGDIYVVDAASGSNKVFKIAVTDGSVSTIAGNGANTNANDALPGTTTVATQIPLLQPRAVKVDAAGNVFIADSGHGRVVKVDPSGNLSLISQVAGGGAGPFPSGLTIYNGKLYIAYGNDQTIARVNAPNSTTTIAGTLRTACDYSTSNCGDGGPGAQATFNLAVSTAQYPLAGIEADSNGLFILDQVNISRGRIRYLNLSGASVKLAGVQVAPNTIQTIAGTGLPSPYDSGLATSAALNNPIGVATDANNNLWITDTINNTLRFVNRGTSAVTIFAGTAAAQTVPAGTIVTVNKDAGSGSTSDGVSVNLASFNAPQGLFITSQGIYVADSLKGPTVGSGSTLRRTGTIRFINTSAATVRFYPNAASPIDVPPGNIATIAGGGNPLSGIGDGGLATGAKLIGPTDVVVNSAGNIFIADVGNKAVRKVNASTGTMTSILGPIGATPPTAAQYTGLGIFGNRLYVVNYDSGHVLREDAAGSSTFTQMDAGSSLSRPRDVAVDAQGNAYVTDTNHHAIVKISSENDALPLGTVTVIAGTSGVQGFGGDQGGATSALLNITPTDLNVKPTPPLVNLPKTVCITISAAGEMLFADSNNNRIRRLR